MAVQQPAMKVSTSKVAAPAMPSKNSKAISAINTACTSRAPSIRRRRSVVSASTPAGRASKNIGRKTAVCTRAARNDEPLTSTISQAAAMACMALPTK